MVQDFMSKSWNFDEFTKLVGLNDIKSTSTLLDKDLKGKGIKTVIHSYMFTKNKYRRTHLNQRQSGH